MVFPSKIHKKAHEEYIAAYEWYEDQKEGLGRKFMNVVERSLMQIRENPDQYSYVKGTYRQAKIDGFPFTIVYQFFPKRKLVHITSIHHTSRNPRTKFRKEK
jgi:toxin ParE1/3/4